MKSTVGQACVGILFSGATLLPPSGLRAETFTWDGDTDGSWGVAANWDAAPVFAAGNEFVFYAAAANLTNFLGTAKTIGGLTFNANADSNIVIRTYSTASGSGGANAILTFNNGAGNAFINIDADAEADISLAPGGGRMYLDSDLVIDHAGSGELRIGNYLDDRPAGSHSITKNGTGLLTIGTASSYPYDGGLIINDGRVRLQGQSGTGTGRLTMNGGALSSVGAAAVSITNNVLLAGNVTLGDATDTGALSFAVANTVTLTNNPVINVASAVTFSGVVGDAGASNSLTKTGSGTLTMGHNNNTFAGGLNINAGAIATGNSDERLGKTGSPLSFTNGATLRWTGGLSVTVKHPTTLYSGGGVIEVQGAAVTSTWNDAISGVGSLTKMGPGTLTLTSANNFSGGLNINGGVVNVANADNRFGGAGGAVSFDGGALRFIGLGADFTTSDRATTLNAGGGAIDVLSADRTITWAGVISGSGGLTKRGAGALRLAVTNLYSGETTVAAGTLVLGAGGALPAGGALTLSGGTLDMGAFTNAPSSLNVTTNSTLALGTGALTFSSQSAADWTGDLVLTGTLGPTSVRFYPDPLTPAQLLRITYNDWGVKLTAEGYLVKAPRATVMELR